MKNIFLIISLTIVLFTNNINAQETQEIYSYYPKLPKISNDDLDNVKSIFEAKIREIDVSKYIKNISIFEDRFEMILKKYSKTIYFSDLNKVQIFKITQPAVPPEPIQIYYQLSNFEELNYGKSDPKVLEDIADYFFYFDHRINVQRYDSLIVAFKPLATQYCALKEKPEVSEMQRKYIVQANVLNQQKMYERAIELYDKAIEIDQTAYPAAYSNSALLSAQISNYDAAIYYMTKYLLLEPEASEARSAQDKIYEWEILIRK